MREKLSFVVVGVFCFSSWTFARDLTWEECLALAKSGNVELAAARESVVQAEASESGARASLFPTVKLSVAQSRTEISSAPALSGPSANMTLSASQNLFAGFADEARMKQASANLRVAQAHERVTRAKVSAEVKEAVARLVFSQDSVELQNLILKRRADSSKLVDFRFRVGRENKGSALLFAAYFEEAKYDKEKAERDRSSSAARLAAVLGLDQGANLRFVGNVPGGEPQPISDLAAIARELPEVQKGAAEEESARGAVLSAQSAFYPSLDLAASIGKIDSKFPVENDKWTAGITLTVPLFDGWRDRANSEVAKSKWAVAIRKRSGIEREALANLTQTYSNYVLAVQKMRVDEKFRLAAVVRAEIARSKYNNGLLNFENWDQVENDLILREKNALGSQRDRILSEAAWEKASGRGVF